MDNTLHGKTKICTGASLVSGREIAMCGASDVVMTGKTAEIHPKLSGAIYTVAEVVRQTGGQALTIQLDVRNEPAIENNHLKAVLNSSRYPDIVAYAADAIFCAIAMRVPAITLSTKRCRLQKAQQTLNAMLYSLMPSCATIYFCRV